MSHGGSGGFAHGGGIGHHASAVHHHHPGINAFQARPVRDERENRQIINAPAATNGPAKFAAKFSTKKLLVGLLGCVCSLWLFGHILCLEPAQKVSLEPDDFANDRALRAVAPISERQLLKQQLNLTSTRRLVDLDASAERYRHGQLPIKFVARPNNVEDLLGINNTVRNYAFNPEFGKPEVAPVQDRLQSIMPFQNRALLTDSSDLGNNSANAAIRFESDGSLGEVSHAHADRPVMAMFSKPTVGKDSSLDDPINLKGCMRALMHTDPEGIARTRIIVSR
jgi:hypothetical protein